MIAAGVCLALSDIHLLVFGGAAAQITQNTISSAHHLSRK
jgi:hypothetical protein